MQLFRSKKKDDGNGGEWPDWDLIYAHLMTITGWSWEYIDEYMTIPRLEKMTEYWSENPPVHILLASILGRKPSGTKAKGSGDSWIARGLTVQQAIEEASKAQPMPKGIEIFASELSEMGVGFQLPKEKV